MYISQLLILDAFHTFIIRHLRKSSYMKQEETAYLFYEALLGECFRIADLVKLLT